MEKKILTEELTKKWNTLEMPIKHYDLPRPYNCIILAQVGVGLSIKPLPQSIQEKNQLILDYAERFGKTIERAEEIITNPDFCLGAVKTDRLTEGVLSEFEEIIRTGIIKKPRSSWLEGRTRCAFI